VTTADDFRDSLHALLTEAIENDVEVRGGWAVFETSSERHGWDIEITEVVKNE
jgi:hypothetical protein